MNSQQELNRTEIFNAILDILNEAVKADAMAVSDLIEHRAPCNLELAAHPTIPVVGFPAKVDALCLINGFVEKLTGKRIMAVYKHGECLIKFDEYIPYEE